MRISDWSSDVCSSDLVRTRPHVEEGDPPEADDRHAVGIDRPAGALGQIIVEHAEKPGGQEEGDGVMAIPPLRHRVLHAGEGGIALGAGERCRNREVVDDVQTGDVQYERPIEQVGGVAVRLSTTIERARIKDQKSEESSVGKESINKV